MRWTAILSALAALAGAALGVATPASAGGFHVEYAFRGGSGDVAFPQGPLLKFGGKLYGDWVTATNAGVVYSFDPATGAEKIEYGFKGGADGVGPVGGLADLGGTLYGVTGAGGASGLGTVFAFNPTSGVETVVYSFKGGSDGQNPFAGLIKVGGLLYGTTFEGGASACSAICGTVFRVDPRTGVETVVYAFKGGADGANPHASLIKIGGALYGTTQGGGSPNCSEGCGTVFKVNPTTGAERVIYAFQGGGDGQSPEFSLVEVGGALFGVTATGGACAESDRGCGVVFKIDPASGAKTVVYAFQGGTDGRIPSSVPMLLGGILYGTTAGDGAYGHGTVFSLDPASGAETVLHAFSGHLDGVGPSGALTYVGRRLFGLTGEGGSKGCGKYGCGTIYAGRP